MTEESLMIGIVSLPIRQFHYNGKTFNSIIAKKYEDWLTSIPNITIKIFFINFDKNIDILNKELDYCSGCLFTGGFIEDVSDENLKKYIETWKYIYTYAKERKLPIWATCLGMEFLMLMELEKKEIFNELRNNNNLLTNLETNEPGFYNYKALPLHDNYFNKKNLFENTKCYFIHNLGYLYNNKLKTFAQKKNIEILALNQDKNENEFISFIKIKDLPFFGTQFHLEPFNSKQDISEFSKFILETWLDLCTNYNINNNRSNTLKNIKFKDNFKIFNSSDMVLKEEDEWLNNYENLYLGG